MHIHACDIYAQNWENQEVLKVLCGEAALAVQLDGGPRFFWPLTVRSRLDPRVREDEGEGILGGFEGDFEYLNYASRPFEWSRKNFLCRKPRFILEII